MVTRLQRIIFALALILGSSALLAADNAELQVRKELTDQTVELWMAKDFRGLDALAAEFISKRSRTPSGLWKIGFMSSVLADQTRFDGDDKTWNALLGERVLQWPKVSPTSPLARILVSDAFMNRAWKARGHGWARQVPPEAWKVFNANIEKSRLYLESTKNIFGEVAIWHTQMLRIATLQGWPEARVLNLLREGMDRDREYFPMYFALLDYYSPRWGGSTAQIETIASRIASAFPKTQGDILYARMYWWAADTHFGNQLIDTNVDCQRMLRGMEAMASEFPDLWNINKFAAFAVDCHDKAAARRYFELIGDKPLLEAWDGDIKYFHMFRAVAYSKD